MRMSAVAQFLGTPKYHYCNGARILFRYFRLSLTRIGFVAGVALLSCTAAITAYAQDTRIAGPFFHETSNSYYELHQLPGYEHKYNWAYVRKLAEQKVHKNVRGQLAVIDSQDVHSFLTKRFTFTGPTWIGLRYFCKTKRLFWVNWKEHKRHEFAAWHQQWAANSRITCLNQSFEYMPAYYIGEGDTHWQLQGQSKAYRWFLVQYKMRD